MYGCTAMCQVLKDLTLDSRHLGLVLPEEVEDLEKKFSLLADSPGSRPWIWTV